MIIFDVIANENARYKRNERISFTEGMVLDSYSSLEVGEAATTSWIFLENGIKCAFLKHFKPIACFFFLYLFYFIAIKSWNGGFPDWGVFFFFLFIRIMLVQKGRTIFPDFLKGKLFYENEEFMHVF